MNALKSQKSVLESIQLNTNNQCTLLDFNNILNTNDSTMNNDINSYGSSPIINTQQAEQILQQEQIVRITTRNNSNLHSIGENQQAIHSASINYQQPQQQQQQYFEISIEIEKS
jgi:hypothetical protein